MKKKRSFIWLGSRAPFEEESRIGDARGFDRGTHNPRLDELVTIACAFSIRSEWGENGPVFGKLSLTKVAGFFGIAFSEFDGFWKSNLNGEK
ncbi:hypothetical protein BPOR_0460g00030 [Botrytis porri]|uniref:Uncharacterized protein n=1 Tax=Botrytis porri TaxID=87229 RepID=A0A4Z1KFK9_9HELO|nr:hypothetical protein BPOR_0460g00030 [Botrytis porri]